MDGKKPMPSDPAERAVYQVQIARMEEKREKERRRKPPPSLPLLPKP